jgi:hypothetical protein
MLFAYFMDVWMYTVTIAAMLTFFGTIIAIALWIPISLWRALTRRFQ